MDGGFDVDGFGASFAEFGCAFFPGGVGVVEEVFEGEGGWVGAMFGCGEVGVAD